MLTEFNDRDVTPEIQHMVELACEKRQDTLEHEYAITEWDLSVMPEMSLDVNKRMAGDHCNQIERAILCLHFPPCAYHTVSVDNR